MGKIRDSIFPLVFVFMVFTISCDEKIITSDIDCNDCYTIKPDSIDLVINWTKNTDFQEIPILLFEGTIEAGEFIDTFFLFGNPAYIWVKAEEEYAIKAIYETSERTLMVVDGTKQRLKRVSSGVCYDYECWVVADEELDVKLRY